MSQTTENVGTNIEQSANAKHGAIKALLGLAGYLTLAVTALPVFFTTVVLVATTLPAVFTTAVFLAVASTGDLGSSIAQVLLG